jgi:hypothetical protein
MKGIIFLGCSYTWGQGLYFYSGFDTLVLPENEYTFNQKEVSHAQIKYKNKFRFARIVADEYKTFEVTRNINGGCEDNSLEFLDNLFVTNFVHEDFSYIILQISHIFRNKFKFEIDGITYESVLDPNNERVDVHNPFYKWYDDNNITPDIWRDLFIKQQVERIKERLLYYEEKGIKSKIITWQEDIVPYLKNDLFLNEKFVRLSYNNNDFETISLLQKTHPNMTIKYDYDSFGDNSPMDHHPSKLCHEVIAESIIKNINKEYEQPTIHPIQRRII